MMAPNPQQMQSRNDKLNASTFLRLLAITYAPYGQSRLTLMNDPRVLRANAHNEMEARASPSIGYSMTLTGIPLGMSCAAAENKLSLSPGPIDVFVDVAASIVGIESTSNITLSGRGFISRITWKAEYMFVPFAGAVLRKVRIASST